MSIVTSFCNDLVRRLNFAAECDSSFNFWNATAEVVEFMFVYTQWAVIIHTFSAIAFKKSDCPSHRIFQKPLKTLSTVLSKLDVCASEMFISLTTPPEDNNFSHASCSTVAGSFAYATSFCDAFFRVTSSASFVACSIGSCPAYEHSLSGPCYVHCNKHTQYVLVQADNFQKPHHPHYCVFQCPLETLSSVMFKVYVSPRQNLCFGDNNFYLTSFSTTFGSFARPTTVWVPFGDVISLLCSPQYMIFAQHSNVQCQLHVIDTSNGYNQWRSQKENKGGKLWRGLGAQPPAASRGRASWSAGQGGKAPLKVKTADKDNYHSW